MILLGILVGVVTGFLSAWGLGGGTLLLIYLVNYGDIPQQTAQGINLLFYLPMALLALPSYKKSGLLERKVVIPTVIGGLLWAILGAWCANQVETELLRKVFGGFLISVGVYTLWKKEEKETS